MSFFIKAVQDSHQLASDTESFFSSRGENDAESFYGNIGLWSICFVVGYSAVVNLLQHDDEVSRAGGLGSIPGMKLYGKKAMHISDGVGAKLDREQVRPALTLAKLTIANHVLKLSLDRWVGGSKNQNDIWTKNMEAYEFVKELSVDLFSAVFLGVVSSSTARHETAKNVEKQSTVFWRAVTSSGFTLEHVPSVLRFVKTGYELGIEARSSLYLIFDAVSSPSVAQDLAHLSIEDRNRHLLLLTSSLAHKSFASVVTSFMMLMGDYPHILRRLQNEIPCECDLDEIHSFEFLDACLKEVERLYPPVIGTYFTVNCDTMRIGGIELKRDAKVWCSILSANRDERVFGETAKAFHPERWLPEKEESCEKIQPHLTYGVGPRNCIGQSLIRTLLLKTCAYLVSIYEWRVVSTSRKFRWLPVARPRDGLILQLKQREDVEEFFDAD